MYMIFTYAKIELSLDFERIYKICNKYLVLNNYK